MVAETLGYGPTGELLWRQVGSRYLFYVGEYATIRAPTQGNITTPGAPVNTSALEVDAHVLWTGARIASVAVAGLGGRTLFYYRTRLGSVVATSIGGGIPGAMYRYTPYGMVDRASNETASTASDLGYTGALRLTGNLVYLKNRVYHSGLKVFLQPDSVDRLRYAYVAGDPVNASDPLGLMPLSFAQAFGAAATGWTSLDDASNQGKESVLDKSSKDNKPPPPAKTAEDRPQKDGVGTQNDQGKTDKGTAPGGDDQKSTGETNNQTKAQTGAEGSGGATGASGTKAGNSTGFPTADDAAKAALRSANPQSIKANVEFGGLIYKDEAGRYNFSGPIEGGDQGVVPARAGLPEAAVRVGDYHTHGDYSTVGSDGKAIRTSDPKRDPLGSDGFSERDILSITNLGKRYPGYSGYLGTPSGRFLKLDATTGKVTVLP